MNQKANLRFFLFLTAPVLTFSFMKNYVDSGIMKTDSLRSGQNCLSRR